MFCADRGVRSNIQLFFLSICLNLMVIKVTIYVQLFVLLIVRKLFMYHHLSGNNCVVRNNKHLILYFTFSLNISFKSLQFLCDRKQTGEKSIGHSLKYANCNEMYLLYTIPDICNTYGRHTSVYRMTHVWKYNVHHLNWFIWIFLGKWNWLGDMSFFCQTKLTPKVACSSPNSAIEICIECNSL